MTDPSSLEQGLRPSSLGHNTAYRKCIDERCSCSSRRMNEGCVFISHVCPGIEVLEHREHGEMERWLGVKRACYSWGGPGLTSLYLHDNSNHLS